MAGDFSFDVGLSLLGERCRKWRGGPGLLYHYTDGTALKSIIETESFWATRVDFMNDRKEFVHGYELFLEEVDRIRKKAGGNPAKIEALDRLQDAVDANLSVYSTSFCHNGDLLSQWRGYGKDQQGYAIGFDLKLPALVGISAQTYDVMYDISRQRKLVQDFAQRYMVEYLSFDDNEGDIEFDVVMSAAIDIETMISIMKDPAFREEGEVRSIKKVYDGADMLVKYRCSKGCIIPYYDLSFKGFSTSVIKEIIIGPGERSQMAEKGLKQYLSSVGLSHVNVKCSMIPYRS